MDDQRTVTVPEGYRLAVSVAPAAWVGDRSARHGWFDDSLLWCGREGKRPVWRRVRQPAPGVLHIEGSASEMSDATWVREVLNVGALVERWDDPLLDNIAQRLPGLAPYGDGSLFEGLVTSIVGQSISVASAAVTQARLSRLFGEPLVAAGRELVPLPTPGQLADASVALIRSSGVTTRRAEALRHIGRVAADGELPADATARADPDHVVRRLLELPQVGPWTAISALHWGIGAPDAWPTGDVALLRALVHATGDDTLTLRTMDRVAERWRPHRGVAARLLWTNLFGTA